MNSSKSDQPKISLAHGGASTSFGGSFQAASFTGSSSYTIPILTSPCRDFHPKLSLNYSSSSGRSVFGLGFDLTIDSVSRQTSKGIPSFDDDKDVFILSGQDYLVPQISKSTDNKAVDNQDSIKRYRPRVDNKFDLIEFVKQNGKKFWRVTDHENCMYIYGYTSKAQIRQPGGANETYRWLLEYAVDRQGNARYYEYKNEDQKGIGDASQLALEKQHGKDTQRYIKTIYYGNSIAITLTAKAEDLIEQIDKNTSQNSWLFHVCFDYGEYNSQLGKDKLTKREKSSPPSSHKFKFSTNIKDDKSEAWLTREDPFSSFEAGFEIRTRRLCRHILMFHNINELADTQTLVHALKLTYQSSISGSQLAFTQPIGTRLSSIKGPKNKTNKNETSATNDLIGNSQRSETLEYICQSLPPASFTYVAFDSETKPEFEELLDVDDQTIPELSSSASTLIDLYGEGLPGILYHDGQSSFYRSRVLKPQPADTRGTDAKTRAPLEITFSKLERIESIPIGQLRSDANHSLSDFTGDGKLDWVTYSRSNSGYFEMGNDKKWGNFIPFTNMPNRYHQKHIHMCDVTGDGQADILLVAGGNVHVYPNERKKGFGGSLPPQAAPKGFPPSLESTPTSYIGFESIDGSGRQHLVRIQHDEICYWPNLGYGRFDEAIILQKTPKFSQNEFNTSRVFFADLTGSGTADLIYLKSKQADVYFNQNGNSISSNPLAINLPTTFDNLNQISFSDLFGNGNQCLIFTQTHVEPLQWVCDFTRVNGQRAKPFLLNQIDNHIGALTNITYRSSCLYYLEDENNSDVTKHWKSTLFNPVQVVKKVEHIDSLASTTTSSHYHYRHGFYDQIEHEFRGFGMVEHTDCELQTDKAENYQFASPLNTKSWYHTGQNTPDDAASIYSDEFFKGDKFASPSPDIIDLDNTNSDHREAKRALKGHVFRTEEYGLDDDKNKGNPYSVITSNYSVKNLHATGKNQYAIFGVHAHETVHYDYERNPKNPRIHQHAILKIDKYGNILQDCDIYYGQISASIDLEPEDKRSSDFQIAQTQNRAIASINTFADPITNTNLHSVLLEHQVFETSSISRDENGAILKFKKLKSMFKIGVSANNSSDVSGQHLSPFPDLKNVSLLEWDRHFYAGKPQNNDGTEFNPSENNATKKPDNLVELPYGTLALPALSSRSQTAALTPQHLSKIKRPIKDQLTPKNGYVKSKKCFWYKGETKIYAGSSHFNQLIASIAPVLSTKQPEGVIRTNYQYDEYKLLVNLITDAHDNEMQVVEFDYHLLHPHIIKDLNDNTSEVVFDPLGRVLATSYYGTEGEINTGFVKDLTSPIIGKSISVDQIIDEPGAYLSGAATAFIYDDFCWMDDKIPNRTISINAEKFPNPSELSEASQFGSQIQAQIETIQVHIAFHDGLSRNIQIATKAESAETNTYVTTSEGEKPKLVSKLTNDDSPEFIWHISDRKTYDNKGKVCHQFEPYFADHPTVISTNILLGKLDKGPDPNTRKSEYLPVITHVYDPKGRETKSISAKGYVTEHRRKAWSLEMLNENATFAASPYNLVNKITKIPSKQNANKSASPIAIGNPPEWYARFKDKQLSKLSEANLNSFKNAIITNKKISQTTIYDGVGHVILQQDVLREPNFANFGAPCLDIGKSGKSSILNTIHKRDARGRLLASSDPRLGMSNIDNFTVIYNLLGQKLYQTSVDAGPGWQLHNALGKLIYRIDGKHTKFFYDFDNLHRPVSLSIKSDNNPNTSKQIVDKTQYGDDDNQNLKNSKQNNLRGKPSHHFDQSGTVKFQTYSVHGHPLIVSQKIRTKNSGLYNWEEDQSEKLLAPPKDKHYRYDGVGRKIQEIDTFGNVTDFGYFLASDIKNQSLTPTKHLNHPTSSSSIWSDEALSSSDLSISLKYNAHGQRTEENIGANLCTTFEYDGATFELTRIHSTVLQTSKLLQDLNYYYDCSGNILSVDDKAFTDICHEANSVKATSTYQYDSLNRIYAAQGIKQNNATDNPFEISDINSDTITTYDLKYSFDHGGNLLRVSDKDQTQPGDMYISTSSNRALDKSLLNAQSSLSDFEDRQWRDDPQNLPTDKNETYKNLDGESQTAELPFFDQNGNQIKTDSIGKLTWNYLNNIDSIQLRKQDSTEAYYYNSLGIRTHKFSQSDYKNEGPRSLTYYFGDMEICESPDKYYMLMRMATGSHTDGGKTHPISIYQEFDNHENSSAEPELIYSLGNNIGSINLRVKKDGSILSYEEFDPFGQTTITANGAQRAYYNKQYRYSDKERDELSGNYYYGHRYLSTGTRRWLSPDPAGTVDGLNLYGFVKGNPIGHADHQGLARTSSNIFRSRGKKRRGVKDNDWLSKSRQNKMDAIARKRQKEKIELHNNRRKQAQLETLGKRYGEFPPHMVLSEYRQLTVKKVDPSRMGDHSPSAVTVNHTLDAVIGISGRGHFSAKAGSGAHVVREQDIPTLMFRRPEKDPVTGKRPEIVDGKDGHSIATSLRAVAGAGEHAHLEFDDLLDKTLHAYHGGVNMTHNDPMGKAIPMKVEAFNTNATVRLTGRPVSPFIAQAMINIWYRHTAKHKGAANYPAFPALH